MGIKLKRCPYRAGVMYVDVIDDLVQDLTRVLPAIVSERVRGRAPTSAFSNFAINREQGLWAESILTDGLRRSIGNEYEVVKYGRSDSIMAGEDGFKEFYKHYQDELDSIGKRPDLLIFPKGVVNSLDISDDDPGGPSGCVKRSLLGIEVRSSSYLAKKYIKAKQKDVSFTPKVEDLQTVVKWIHTYGVPHYYAQVFFDEIHVISFRRILEIILHDDKNYSINKNQRNQFKSTIHVDISCGRRWGKLIIPPTHESRRKELNAGRLIHYVKFGNGIVDLEKDITNSLIAEALGSK